MLASRFPIGSRWRKSVTESAYPGGLPPRISFPVMPRGLATWQKQRLSNFILDIAESACVPPQAVLNRLIAWPTCVSDRPFGSCMRLEQVNGRGTLAARWATAVEPLVGMQSLAETTMVPFAHVLGGSGGFMASRRRWCWQCLRCDVLGGGKSYERLLWSIADVRVCPLHEIELFERCPECGDSRVSELSSRCLSAHCARCRLWFGEVPSKSRGSGREQSQDAFNLWVAKDYANLLALGIEEAAQLSRDNVRKMLKAGVAAFCKGSYPAFAELVGISSKTVGSWYFGINPVSTKMLVRLSWIFRIPMRSWLEGDVNCWARMGGESMTVGESEQHVAKPVFRHNWKAIRARLEASLTSDKPYPSWAAAARDMGFDGSYLRTRFPDLCVAIRDAGRQRRRQQALENEQRRLERESAIATECVGELISKRTYPSKNLVEAMIAERGVNVTYRTFDLIRLAKAYYAKELQELRHQGIWKRTEPLVK